MDARFAAMPEEKKAWRTDQLRDILAEVSFGPSCVDMGWQWEIKEINTAHHDVDQVTTALSGWLVNTTFRRPERTTGEIGIGRGRQFWIDVGATESAIVKTAFVAAKMIVEHELMEAFLYKGTRIFDPHNTVHELASLQLLGGSTLVR